MTATDDDDIERSVCEHVSVIISRGMDVGSLTWTLRRQLQGTAAGRCDDARVARRPMTSGALEHASHVAVSNFGKVTQFSPDRSCGGGIVRIHETAVATI